MSEGEIFSSLHKFRLTGLIAEIKTYFFALLKSRFTKLLHKPRLPPMVHGVFVRVTGMIDRGSEICPI